MDVKVGHCWRCEKAIGKKVLCSICGVAKYCTVKCYLSDVYRHNAECEEWRPKSCSNLKCTASGQTLKECSACNNAWYCGETCQRKHWKDHKQSCSERTREIKSAGVVLQSFFEQQRRGIPLAAPYYIGNALAIDMLNLQGNECKEGMSSGEGDPMKNDYNIMSAGCGNLRNWIHTVTSLPKQFEGKVHTLLNDIDPFVQARNVLHLFMMIIYPDEEEIPDTITTLWYSLHLTEKDYKFLIDCLTALHGLTASALGVVTSGVIQLTEADMSPMREVWQGWLNLECRRGHPNYINLHRQRQQVLKNCPLAADGIKFYRKELPSELLRSFDEYLERGDFQSFGVDSKHCELQYDNPTLTGFKIAVGLNDADKALNILNCPRKLQFVYCVGSDLSPFGTWDYLEVKKKHYNKSMITMFHGYISDQLKKVITYLKAGSLTTSFNVWHCLDLQLGVKSRGFDRIFTSNIADYTGTQPLLKAMKPLLNRDNKYSTIVTQYWNWYGLFPYAQVYGPESAVSGAAGERALDGTIMSCADLAVRDIHSASDSGQAKLNNPTFMRSECENVMLRDPNVLQEYFNNTTWFVSYLKAEFLVINEPFQESSSLSNPIDLIGIIHPGEHEPVSRCPVSIPKPVSREFKSKKVPSFQKVKESEGLRLRDFRRGELNKVVPFKYRRNVRLVNMFRGMERMLEWYCP